VQELPQEPKLEVTFCWQSEVLIIRLVLWDKAERFHFIKLPFHKKEMSYLIANPKRGQNILTTLSQMLNDRGFHIQEPFTALRAGLEGSTERAQKYYEEHECLMKATRGDDLMVVMAPKEDKLAIDTVRKYVEQYQSQPHTHVLIVIQNITPAARQVVVACKRFELFYEADLFCNKTRHRLYVPHRALNPDEEADVLKRYKCKKTNLPSLRKTDPIARYFAWSVGTMVEIKSNMGGSIEPSVSYRVVVDE